MTPAGGPPIAGEWGALLSAPTIPVRELARAQVPDEPGVYLWRHQGQAVYVGMATRLRGRTLSKHLGRGLSLAGSSLRRNVCGLLFGIPPSVTSNPNRQKVTAEQAAAIGDWLRSCDLSWQECSTVDADDQLERRLRREFMPSLNRL